MNKTIILLSGGLDSLVCLGLCKNDYNIELALTFDYGQKSALKEISSAAALSKYYKIKHKIIKLDWLKEITNNPLVTNDRLPTGAKNDKNSAKSVWVPNRNGLFLNIAASFAESDNYSNIIIGANKEEGANFSDNTQEFINRVSAEFEYSTLIKPIVTAPLINYTKNDIVKLALEYNMPLELVQSCYDSTKKHCGKCDSCTRLKDALMYNKADKYIKMIFKE